jgi:flagellar basal-body rod modification protein FlgD
MTTTSDIMTNAGLTSASSLTTTPQTGVNNIDQAGFLKLMTTQLQYQDPFSPMDNNQMVAQMAQFSQLQSTSQSNTYLQNISDALTGTRLSDAASWIGKSMLVSSDIATPDRSGAYAGQITLSQDAQDVAVDLVDSSGATVKTIDLGAQKAGNAGFLWDGTDGNGNAVGNGGPLEVRVRGGQTSAIDTWATIAAVQSPASGADAQLITALGNFKPSDALRLG